MAVNVLTTLVYPHQTMGGPSDPEKGPNKLSNMRSFWYNEYVHGSSPDSLLHLQCHKATYAVINVAKVLAGSDPVEMMRANRERQGDMNTDCYRIIIAQGPQYAAVATSNNFDLIKNEYMVLHTMGQAFLTCYRTREAAAQEFIAWVIKCKLNMMVDRWNLSSIDKETTMFELSQLQSMPPLQLANLERSYYNIWKQSETVSQTQKERAELMTWACSWEIEEVVRKFKNRRHGDQWGMEAFLSLSRPEPQGQPSPRNEVEQHPVYGIFFRMIRSGISRAAVEQKMRDQNLDASLLDHPDRVIAMQYGGTAVTARQFEANASLKTVSSAMPSLGNESDNENDGRVASGPYASVVEYVLNMRR